MKNHPHPISVWLLPALLLLLSAACTPPLKTAAWVVRFDLDSPEKATTVCRQAKESGFDELLVQVRGRADAHYLSDLAPRAENLVLAPADFDPLAVLINDCAPLPIHAWLNVFYLWGGKAPPDNPRHPGHPDQPWILSDNNGKPVSLYSTREKRLGWIEGAYADPASREYRRLFAEVVRELLARYPVAGIHLDFVRYPGPGYGKGEAAAAEFKEFFALDPRLLPDRLDHGAVRAWLADDISPADRVLTTAALFWNEFRAGQVSELVREVRTAIRESGAPQTKLSAAVFPDPAAAYLENGQEWQAWAAAGLVDALYPMTYFGDLERVDAQLIEIAGRTSGNDSVSLWAGLGPAGKTQAQISREAQTAGLNGYQGVALFSLGHLQKNPPVRAWQEAARARSLPKAASAAPDPPSSLAPAPATLAPPSLPGLKHIAAKALGGAPLSDDLDDRLRERLAEYEQARQAAIPAALAQLASGPVSQPESLELTGIFRYAHPLDSPARWQEQEALCEKARQRLMAGEEPSQVAGEISQDPSRTMGGKLAPRLLDPLNPEDRELARLQPGETSRVLRAANGFWCFHLASRSPGQTTTFAAASWEARRILLRGRLSQILTQPEQNGRQSSP